MGEHPFCNGYDYSPKRKGRSRRYKPQLFDAARERREKGEAGANVRPRGSTPQTKCLLASEIRAVHTNPRILGEKEGSQCVCCLPQRDSIRSCKEETRDKDDRLPLHTGVKGAVFKGKGRGICIFRK